MHKAASNARGEELVERLRGRSTSGMTTRSSWPDTRMTDTSPCALVDANVILDIERRMRCGSNGRPRHSLRPLLG